MNVRNQFESAFRLIEMIIVCMILAILFAPIASQAADRENYHVRNLQIGDASVKLTATAGGLKNTATASTAAALDEQGNYVIDDETVIDADNLFRIKPASYTSGGGAALPITSSMLLLTVTNDAGGGTITNTIPEPGVGNIGAFLTVINIGVSNSVLIAEASPLAMAGNVTLGPKDAIGFYAVTTNDWIERFRVNN